VRGYDPGLESWLIDRYNLHWSQRTSKGEKLPIDPASRIEDWTTLIEQVIERGYRLAADPGKRMRILMTACDSGGRAGVTGRAYEFYRMLAARRQTSKFILVKGAAGFVHFPDWLGRWFFDELSREVRTPKGWAMMGRKGGNEALDLLCYDRAAAIVLNAERINWDAPPPWARPQDTNPTIVDADRPAPKPEPSAPEKKRS
jgi:phage terminase large subunit GpA-like protein